MQRQFVSIPHTLLNFIFPVLRFDTDIHPIDDRIKPSHDGHFVHIGKYGLVNCGLGRYLYLCREYE